MQNYNGRKDGKTLREFFSKQILAWNETRIGKTLYLWGLICQLFIEIT